jgi:hypothetical protein
MDSTEELFFDKASKKSLDSLQLRSAWDVFRFYLRITVTSIRFEIAFSCMIVANCVSMGAEAEQLVKGPDSVWSERFLAVLEHVFTAFFTVEIMLKAIAFGSKAFSPSRPDGYWNIADFFLVMITCVFFTWILPLLSAVCNFDSDGSLLRILSIFRAVRLLRLVRVFQKLPMFREAWLLMRGLMDSTRVLFWTIMVIMFLTYVFAIMGMVMITKELSERQEAARSIGDEERVKSLGEILRYVGGLDELMYTLIQLLTLDSWNFFVRPMIAEISWCWAYFYAYIAVAVFVLMNLVTAIIVENAVMTANKDEDQALKDKEKKQRGELRQLETLFEGMDIDGSGTLSWEEFKAAFDDEDLLKKWRLLDFEPEDCRELWGLLDDGTGEIATFDFFEGLSKMKGSAQSKDIFRVHKSIQMIIGAVQAVCTHLEFDAGSSICDERWKKRVTNNADRNSSTVTSAEGDMSRVGSIGD